MERKEKPKAKQASLKMKVERRNAVKTKIQLPRKAKFAIAKLTVALEENGIGDGTEHNTILYCITQALSIKYNPFKNIEESKNMVLLNTPPELHYTLSSLAKGANTTSIQDFIETAVVNGLKLLTDYKGEPVLNLSKVQTNTHIEKGTTVVIESVLLKNPEGVEKEYSLHAPSEWAELGYKRYSHADYDMRYGNAQQAIVAGKSLIAKPVKENE